MTLTLTNKDKILLIGLGIVIILLLCFQFIISPSLKSISNVKDTIESNKNKLSELENKKVQNVILKKSINKLKAQYDENKSDITQGTKDGDISTSLVGLVNKNKLKLTSINYTQGSNYSGSNNNSSAAGSANAAIGQIMKMSATLAVSGNLDDVNNFLADLEHTDRLNTISNVSVSKADNVYSANISTDYYYFYNDNNE